LEKLVEPPINHEVVGCERVFKVKYDNDGMIDQLKGGKGGYAQQYGIDYSIPVYLFIETFSTI